MVLFAIFGACVKWLNIKKQHPTTFLVLSIEATTAAFVGFLVYSLYTWLILPAGLAFMVAGLSGYVGPKAIELLLQGLIRYFKLEDLLLQVNTADTQIGQMSDNQNAATQNTAAGLPSTIIVLNDGETIIPRNESSILRAIKNRLSGKAATTEDTPVDVQKEGTDLPP